MTTATTTMKVIDGTGEERMVGIGDTIHGWYEQSPVTYIAYCERVMATGHIQSPREKLAEMLRRMGHMKWIARQDLRGKSYRVHAENSSTEGIALAESLSRLSDDEAASQWQQTAERLGLDESRPIKFTNYGAGGETPLSEL